MCGYDETVTLTVVADAERPFCAAFPPSAAIREVLSEYLSTDDIKAIQIGGPVYPFLGREALEKTLSDVTASGCAELMLPIIRIVRMNSDIAKLTASLMSFLCGESCGKCVFCREGVIHIRGVIDSLIAGRGSESDLDLIVEIGQMMRGNSMCAFGRAAADPVLSCLELFHDEYERLIGRVADAAADPVADPAAWRDDQGAPDFGSWREAIDSVAPKWQSALENAIAAGSDHVGSSPSLSAKQSFNPDAPPSAARSAPGAAPPSGCSNPGAPIKVTIDGREVETEQGKTVLEVCLDAGVYIPHLCRHNALRHLSACRLCVVEIDGMDGLMSSCATASMDGMTIRTESEAISETRRMAMELMLSGHQADCGTCIKYLNCELQSLKQFLIGDELKVARRSRLFGTVETDPIFTREPNKCVLCGRCVRACRELRGVGVLEYKHDHGETYIGIGPDPNKDIPLADAGCRFCGACAEVCPTGAILDRNEFGQNKSRKESLLPCVSACPAEIDIPRFIRYIREGRSAEAVAVIREKVPFPRVLGLVCGRPCEAVCRRGQVNEPMSICGLKRYAAENDMERSWTQNIQKKPETGKRVAVIGAGPSGLTAAYYLTLFGHSATVFEEMPLPGGMLRYGIPAYKLPSDVLDSEIEDILNAGVSIKTNAKIESVDQLAAGDYDAALIAIGAQKGVMLRIPGVKGSEVFTGAEFLKAAHTDMPIIPGGKVVALGGGNVAFDCARTALRLGAREVMLACLESRETMPASVDEIDAGEEEGIKILPSRSFLRIQREDGRVTGVVFQNVASFSTGEEGTLIVEIDEDSEHFCEADTVIFAVGQKPDIPEDFGVEITAAGFIDASPSGMAVSGVEGVFAVSDAVTGTDKVVNAIVAGRKAAQVIDKYLGGRGRFDVKPGPVPVPMSWLDAVDGFPFQLRAAGRHEPPEERICDFRLVDCGLEKPEAEYEAGRCLQCDLRLNMKPEKFWSGY